jgi:hypothetical protein
MASQQVLTALEELHQELSKLTPAIRHIEAAAKVADTVKDIPQKHLDLLNDLKNADTIYKAELNGMFNTELAQLAEESKKIAQSTREIQQQAKTDLDALVKVRESVQLFHDRIERINFPDRLDKLDTNVSGIMLATQSIQNRLDNLERNLTDRLKELGDRQKEAQEVLNQSMTTSFKKNQLIMYITWGIIALTTAAAILISRH